MNKEKQNHASKSQVQFRMSVFQQTDSSYAMIGAAAAASASASSSSLPM